MRNVSLRQALRSERARGREKRGVALLMALIMVVLMTAYISEFNYSARARILSAAHARDDLRAFYLANSGVRIYQLLLAFGNQIGNNQMIQGMMTNFGLPPLDGATMVCKDLPFFDTAMLRFLLGSSGMNQDEQESGLLDLMGFGGGDDDDDDKPEITAIGSRADQPTLRRSLFDFEGDFKVSCSDESAKIDLNGLAHPNWLALPGGIRENPVAIMLFAQMSPEEYDPLFEERLKLDRWELIARIKDYIDPGRDGSGTFGGDESRPYDDFEPRYEPKDKLFDTVEEARMVAGVTDEVFATFAPAWTVHNRGYKVNINTASPQMLRALVRAVTDPSIVSDVTIDQFMPMVSVYRMIVPFRNADQFIQLVQQGFNNPSGQSVQGLALNPNTALVDAIKKQMSVKSDTFHLTSTGFFADSTRSMDVTIRMRRLAPRYLDWRER